MFKKSSLIQAGLVIIMGLSIKTIYNYQLNLNETENIVEHTKELYEEIKLTPIIKEEEEVIPEDPVEKSKRFIETLQKEFPDTIGYINIENTNISYPIVQTLDNEFYLNHSPSKTYNANGSIFMSYLNSPDFEDDNTVIYGHNIKSGKLFQNLHLFKSQDFYNNNNVITISTPTGPKEYLIFSVYKTNPQYQYKTPNYQTEEEKREFIDDIINKSLVKPTAEISDIINQEYIKLLTLSTCETGGHDRFVVHGVEVMTELEVLEED